MPGIHNKSAEPWQADRTHLNPLVLLPLELTLQLRKLGVHLAELDQRGALSLACSLHLHESF